MSQETQAFNEEMVKKFNSIINNSDKFLGPSTKSTSTAPSESTLITSVKDTRDKISETMDIFKNYYIGQYTNAEWEKLNKGPYGVPLLLVTGIEPDKKSKPINFILPGALVSVAAFIAMKHKDNSEPMMEGNYFD